MNETECPQCGETLKLEYDTLGEPEYHITEIVREYCESCGYER